MRKAAELRIIQVDLNEPSHGAAVLAMTRDYARDPMGNGSDLPDELQAVLVDRLRRHPTTLVFLAFYGDQPVGIATCFLGFSTFAAQPLLNIHDLHVAAYYRGRGVGRSLLNAVERKARELGCCKLTLEVQENNHTALALYDAFGFESGQYEPAAGAVLFRQKKL